MEPLAPEKARSLLETAMVGHLGVVADGEPYVTPISFVVDGNRILFRTKVGRKLAAIDQSPRVCLEICHVDEESGDWESVLVTGSAQAVDDRPTGELTVHLLYEKYSRWLGSPLDRGGLQTLPGWPQVVAIEIDSISGVSSHDGFSSRTRPGRL